MPALVPRHDGRQVAEGQLDGEVNRRQHEAQQDPPAHDAGEEGEGAAGDLQLPGQRGGAVVGLEESAREADEGHHEPEEEEHESHVGPERRDHEEKAEEAHPEEDVRCLAESWRISLVRTNERGGANHSRSGQLTEFVHEGRLVRVALDDTVDAVLQGHGVGQPEGAWRVLVRASCPRIRGKSGFR